MAETIVDLLRGSERACTVRAAALKGTAEALLSLPARPGVLQAFESELLVSSIHASAAISGNPMGIDDVRQELERGPDRPVPPSGPTVARARREISNLALAYDPLPIGRTAESVFGVSEGFVKKVHAVLAQGTVQGGLGEYAPAADGSRTQAQTQTEMLKLITWVNTSESTSEPALLRAALFHFGLFSLRPFNEANGRVARFFETSILTVAGLRFVSLMLPAYYHRNIDQYLGFFQPEGDRRTTAFVEFMLEGVQLGMAEVRSRLLEPLRTLALKDYFENLRDQRVIKTRLFEFLNLLLDHQGSFLLKDLFLRQPFKLLYNTVSEHTARRDLGKLINLNLLHKNELRYTFNRNILDC